MSGGAASGQKGSSYERELVNAVRAWGWGAMRTGGSGSGTVADRADVIVSSERKAARPRNSYEDRLAEVWLVEAKSGKGNRLYVDEREVDALVSEAKRWGARPLLGARSTEQAREVAHYLVPPDECGRTDEGAYALVFENATRTDDLLVDEIAYAVVHPETKTQVSKVAVLG